MAHLSPSSDATVLLMFSAKYGKLSCASLKEICLVLLAFSLRNSSVPVFSSKQQALSLADLPTKRIQRLGQTRSARKSEPQLTNVHLYFTVCSPCYAQFSTENRVCCIVPQVCHLIVFKFV